MDQFRLIANVRANNEPNYKGMAHSIVKAHCSTMRAFPLGNNEPRFREIISPRKMSNSEKISTVRSAVTTVK